MNKLLVRFYKLIYLLRGKCLSIYLRWCCCKVGTGLKCRQWPNFRQFPYKNISIGNNVTIGQRITFDVHRSGELVIGNNVNLTQDIVISVCEQIVIGNYTMIGEFVSIRDADHGTNPDEYMCKQALNAARIVIGEDVWIAAGCRVLKGAMIPDGCVVGANAVVTKKSFLDKTAYKGIYAGVPAVFKKPRT